MLFAEPTPMGAGVTLWGDYHDLRSLYDMVGRAVDAAPEDIGDFIVALNYDIRHAYEGQREKKTFGQDETDRVRYRGVKILWPHVLPQAALVRYYAAFIDTTKEDQANMFRLEHSLGRALMNHDPEIGQVCVDWLSRPLHLSANYFTEFFDEVAHRFIADTRGKKRFENLPAILRSFSELSPEYRAFKAARESGNGATDVRGHDDYPTNFRW